MCVKPGASCQTKAFTPIFFLGVWVLQNSDLKKVCFCIDGFPEMLALKSKKRINKNESAFAPRSTTKDKKQKSFLLNNAPRNCEKN